VEKIINGTRQTKKRRHPKQTTARKPKQRGKTVVPGTIIGGQPNALAGSTRSEDIAADQATEAPNGAPRGELPPGKYIFFPTLNFKSMLCLQLAELVVPQKIHKSQLAK
jgi:hypothetical protein